MANKIIKSKFQTPWRYLYGIGISIIILGIIGYTGNFLIRAVLSNLYNQRQNELVQVEEAIKKIGSEKAVFSYQFADELSKQKTTKRSDQVTALIEVLREVQLDNTIGKQNMQLSDFSISPSELTLKGKVSNLILLYYSSPANNYIDLLTRFSQLSFITDLSIKKYQKIGDFYEFSLHADINPNAIIQELSEPTSQSRDNMNDQ